MRAGEGTGSGRVSGVRRSSAGVSSFSIRSTSVSTRKGQYSQGRRATSRRWQAFSICIRRVHMSAISGSSVGGSSGELRRRGEGIHLCLGPVQLVVQLVSGVLVELHVAEHVQHVHGRLEHEHLRCRCVCSGTRRPMQSVGCEWCAGRGRGHRAAPHAALFVCPRSFILLPVVRMFDHV